MKRQSLWITLGGIGALIAIISLLWPPIKEIFFGLRGTVELKIEKTVEWREEGIPASVTVVLDRGDPMTHKIVVFQRNMKEGDDSWHFMFEAPLSDSTEVTGPCWFGSSDVGNKDYYLVRASVAPADKVFKKEVKYSLEDFSSTILASQTVQRLDSE